LKIIFLDVDGVLNNSTWASELHKQGTFTFLQNDLYEPALLMLRDLVEETGAKIVLSSSWRKFPNARGDLVDALAKHNLTIHSDTPDTGGIRGEDIKAWLSSHSSLSIESYIILDDEADMLEDQLPYLVQTTFEKGLLDCHYRRAKAILNHYKLNRNIMPNEIFWQLVSNMLPEQGEFHNDLHTHYTFFQDGDQILCRNEAKLNALVDLFDDIGLTSVTGYYDPEEDKKNNCVDSLTGFYYLELD